MPSPEFIALALLIVLVLAVALVNTWLLTRRPSGRAPLPDDIPMPTESFESVPPPSEPQAVRDAAYAKARRYEQHLLARHHEQRETRPLAESEWYGSGGDGDGYWPQAR